MKEKNRQRRLRLVAEAKKKPAVFTVYIILRLIVVAILVSSILRGESVWPHYSPIPPQCRRLPLYPAPQANWAIRCR